MMAEWVGWVVAEVVHEVPQLALLGLAFAFTTGALVLAVMAFEYIYRRMSSSGGGGRLDPLTAFFHRDVAALDQMVDEIDDLQRLRDQHRPLPGESGSSRDDQDEDEGGAVRRVGDDDAEFDLLQRDADIEQQIMRRKLAWAGRREHLLRKQHMLRVSGCLCVTLLIFWRLGALDSRWCSLSDTHRQLVHSLLAHTTAVLNAGGIEYWADGPTLLVTYRDNALSEWDDRIVLATWKENQPKLWNTLRDALEQRQRYYLEKYREPVLPTANPPAFRLHYASLQRHFNKLPYLDIYLYNREGSTDTDKPEMEMPVVKESAVVPLRNLTLEASSLVYRVPIPHDVPSFLRRSLGDAYDERATEEAHHRSEKDSQRRGGDDLRGYKALTCQIYRDQGNNLGLLALAGTLIYFGLVVFALPRVSYNSRWRF